MKEKGEERKKKKKKKKEEAREEKGKDEKKKRMKKVSNQRHASPVAFSFLNIPALPASLCDARHQQFLPCLALDASLAAAETWEAWTSFWPGQVLLPGSGTLSLFPIKNDLICALT